MTRNAPLKPVEWVGSSRSDLSAFPVDVRKEAGFAISLAQNGDKSVNAVPMVGFGGASVLEVVMPSEGNTYRAIYTVRSRKRSMYFTPFRRNRREGSRRRNPTSICSTGD